MRKITVPPGRASVNEFRSRGLLRVLPTAKGRSMLLGILITLIITAGLGSALRRDGRGGLIARRPYNNRYNDASGAREDHLG